MVLCKQAKAAEGVYSPQYFISLLIQMIFLLFIHSELLEQHTGLRDEEIILFKVLVNHQSSL